MAERTVSLTAEEWHWLENFLENALKDTRIEEHRTRTPSFREHVLHREDLILGLLDKLREPAGRT